MLNRNTLLRCGARRYIRGARAMSGGGDAGTEMEQALLDDALTTASSAVGRSGARRGSNTVPLRSVGGDARVVFEATTRGRAAAADYRRREARAAASRPPPYNPPRMARLCDELCFGAQLDRHRQSLAPAAGADSKAGVGGGAAAGWMQPSFAVLVPTCLMGTIAQTTLTPILPQLKQQFFGTGHAAATVSGWTDSAGFCIGFLVAGIIGKLSDCYGRRSVIIAQKVSSLLCLAALAFRAQLHNNLWIYIGMSVAQNAVTGESSTDAHLISLPRSLDLAQELRAALFLTASSCCVRVSCNQSSPIRIAIRGQVWGLNSVERLPRGLLRDA